MNPSQTRSLWVSIGAAIFAMFLIYSYSQEKKAAYDRKFGTTKRVVVAAKDILEISTIDDTMVQVMEYPANYVQPGAVESPEDAVGLVASAPIQKGEQILANKLLAPGPHTGLSLQVAPDRRAVAIPVDEVRGIGKLLRPGDRIDILASVETGKGMNKKVEVKTLMQQVVVLATGQNVTNGIPRKLEMGGAGGNAVYRNLNGDTTFSSITVEVTPKQAQDLVLMLTSSPGSLYLALRNPNDRVVKALGVSTVNSVLGRSARPIAPRRFPAASTPKRKAPPKKKSKRRSKRRNKSGFIDVN